MQRSLPNAVSERRVFDSTIAEQAQLAVRGLLVAHRTTLRVSL